MITSAPACRARRRRKSGRGPARWALPPPRWTRPPATSPAARRRDSSSGSLPSGAHLLILDEPTNHLDIDSREALVHALADFSGAVILISHDRHLIEASADRLWLVAGGTVVPYDSDIDDYRRLILDGPETAGEKRTTGSIRAPAQDRRKAAAERRAQSAPLRLEIKETEALIERLQKEIQVSDRLLADPKLYENPAMAAERAKARADAVKSLTAAEERWLALSTEHEKAEGQEAPSPDYIPKDGRPVNP